MGGDWNTPLFPGWPTFLEDSMEPDDLILPSVLRMRVMGSLAGERGSVLSVVLPEALVTLVRFFWFSGPPWLLH